MSLPSGMKRFMVWDFQKDAYHDWVTKEGHNKKFPALIKCDDIVKISFKKVRVRCFKF